MQSDPASARSPTGRGEAGGGHAPEAAGNAGPGQKSRRRSSSSGQRPFCCPSGGHQSNSASPRWREGVRSRAPATEAARLDLGTTGQQRAAALPGEDELEAPGDPGTGWAPWGLMPPGQSQAGPARTRVGEVAAVARTHQAPPRTGRGRPYGHVRSLVGGLISETYYLIS